MKVRKSGKVATVVMSFLISIVLIAGCGANNNEAANSKPPQSSDTGASSLSGSVEVGVMAAEGTSDFNFTSGVGDQIAKDNPGAEFSFTFANTKARPVIDQRWRAGNPPDIDNLIFNGQFPKTHENVPSLMDLTPYLNETLPGTDTKWIDTFSPSAQSFMQYDNKYYGVITDINAIALYYNKKIFDDLQLTPPTTWDEFMDVSQKLKENNIDPIAVTGTYNPYMGLWVDYLFQREVGTEESVNAVRGEGFKNNPGFLEAAKKIERVRDNGYLMNGFQGTDFTAAQVQFFQGKAGMVLMGTWLTSEMKDSIPADFQLGITAFPTVDGGAGEQNGLMAHANIMAMNKNTKSPELAMEFLRRFTSVEVQTQRSQEQSTLSSIKGVPVSDQVTGMQGLLDNGGDYLVRNLGLEFEPDIYNAYYLEVSKLFFDDYTAEQFIDGIDKVAKDFKK